MKKIALLATALAAATTAQANEFEGALRSLAEAELRGWLTDPALLAAIEAQNARHTGLTAAQIGELDATWMAEVGAPVAPMIDGILARPESLRLRELQEAAAGLITEVFVMDNLGLNVAQSDVTSDFWQGDEAKWQETYPAGPDAIHISDVEYDDSTQTYQSQVSLTVVDPATGQAIGAATFGVDVSLLQ